MTLLQKIEASARSPVCRFPPKVSPREEVSRYRNFLKVETHRLKILHRAGGEGREICRARSAIIDLLLQNILDGVIGSSPELEGGAPVFALGGHGRLWPGRAESAQRPGHHVSA